MSFVAPPLPPYAADPGNMQVWWQLVLLRLGEALDAQQTQIDALVALNSDDVLTPAKKPMWIFFNSFLTGEQSALDTEATTYGITTEKTNYDNALSALATYLATLTTPVAWNDFSGDTDIVGTTLRTKFNDVLVKKQALLNKLHDKAKTLADTAQTQANTATTNAAAAQTTATAAKLNDKISASATAPSQLLSAADTGGGTASITIATHDRIYGDNTTLDSVVGATLTGLANATVYGVYHDDATCANTGPTYHATTNLKTAQFNYVAGRHFDGQITTPAGGAGGTSGGINPPGGGGPYP